MPAKPIDPETQLEHFREAVELLGGQRSTGRYLNISERNVRYLVAGDRPLHDGYLKDTAEALRIHADKCRKLERLLSPEFSANLTEEQAENFGKPDARRFDQRGKKNG